jgi:hypothetical protein
MSPSIPGLGAPFAGLHLHQTSRSVQEVSHRGYRGVWLHLPVKIAEKVDAVRRVEALCYMDGFHAPSSGGIEVTLLIRSAQGIC